MMMITITNFFSNIMTSPFRMKDGAVLSQTKVTLEIVQLLPPHLQIQADTTASVIKGIDVLFMCPFHCKYNSALII